MCRSLIGALTECHSVPSSATQRHECELAKANWVILPLLNPDGYSLTWKDIKVFDNWRYKSSRFWRQANLFTFLFYPVGLRKNRQFDGTEKSKCMGIDLNRNSAVGWTPNVKYTGLNAHIQLQQKIKLFVLFCICSRAFKLGNVTTSCTSPCSESYKGNSSFSAVELKVWKEVIESPSFNFDAYLSLHSFGRTILYPYSTPKKYLQSSYTS